MEATGSTQREGGNMERVTYSYLGCMSWSGSKAVFPLIILHPSLQQDRDLLPTVVLCSQAKCPLLPPAGSLPLLSSFQVPECAQDQGPWGGGGGWESHLATTHSATLRYLMVTAIRWHSGVWAHLGRAFALLIYVFRVSAHGQAQCGAGTPFLTYTRCLLISSVCGTVHQWLLNSPIFDVVSMIMVLH